MAENSAHIFEAPRSLAHARSAPARAVRAVALPPPPSFAASVFVVVRRSPFRAALPCISGIMQSVSRQGFLTLRPPPTADAPAAPPPIERVEGREMRDALIVCRSDKLIVYVLVGECAREMRPRSVMTHDS